MSNVCFEKNVLKTENNLLIGKISFNCECGNQINCCWALCCGEPVKICSECNERYSISHKGIVKKINEV